jgi:phage tail sheath protein FI
MPVTPTYPGVYIEEIPSGVRTIAGVATSITAFVGRAPRGPVNDPTDVFSFGAFERVFGGLNVNYPLAYAVRDFFLNAGGGSHAIVVRLHRPPAGTQGDGSATFAANGLTLKAANPGNWGNQLSIRVDRLGISDEVVERYGLAGIVPTGQFFNLTVVENPPNGQRESFRNVSLHPLAGSRRVDRVLERESSLVRFDGTIADGANLAPPDNTAADADPTNRDNYKPPKRGENVQKFANGVSSDPLVDTDYLGLDANNNPQPKAGIRALEKADLFNILCIPPDRRDGDTTSTVYAEASLYCVLRRAMLIVDPPGGWGANKETAADAARDGLPDLNINGTPARNAALYFPRVIEADPLREGQPDTFAPCGLIAGIYARTDRERGVWKAPAGLDAGINGIIGLQVNLTDDENGMLNPLGINCLRFFQVGGRVVWGSRTMRGADQLADEYKYVPVRRLALYIEESLYRGTQWVVFEPNDEPLWAQIRLNVGAFMQGLFRQGAFQGRTPREAYLVKCDKETTTQYDIDRGIVNIVVGFAPLKPAEFVIIKIQQLARQEG